MKKLGVQFMNYTPETLERALQDVRRGTRSIRDAAETYGIPKSTISDKLKNRHSKKQGGQTALSAEDERFLSEGIQKFGEWGFPLTRSDIRHLVKSNLDRKGMRIAKFRDNMPGKEWFYCFLNRNKRLTERLAQNIKRVRANVTREKYCGIFFKFEGGIGGSAKHEHRQL